VHNRASVSSVFEALLHQPGAFVPDGVLHGFEQGQGRTLCGRPLLELYEWPDLHWPPANDTHGAACSQCHRVARD